MVSDIGCQDCDLPHLNGYRTKSVASKVGLPKGGDVTRVTLYEYAATVRPRYRRGDDGRRAAEWEKPGGRAAAAPGFAGDRTESANTDPHLERMEGRPAGFRPGGPCSALRGGPGWVFPD